MQNTNFFFRSFVCIAVMAVLSVLAVDAWGRCDWGETVGMTHEFGSSGTCQMGETACAQYAPYNGSACYYGKKLGGYKLVDSECLGYYKKMTCWYQRLCCDNECEADSVANGGIPTQCVFDVEVGKYCYYFCHDATNCTAGGCEKRCFDNAQLCGADQLPPDSVVVCQNATQVEDGPIYTQMLLFKCVGADNADGYDDTQCRFMMNVPGTCGQNGYQSGVNKDTLASEVDCFAAFENTCYMQDKKSMNTFACSCDNNSCYLAKLAVASGDCKNPYASSSPSSSGSSSPSSSPSSSATSGGSSSPSSSGGERPPESVDSPKTDSAGVWNYNYSGILNAINNNVIWVGNGVQSLNSSVQSLGGSMERMNENSGATRANTQLVASNTQYTNTLLNQKVIPAIQSASSAITGKLDQVHGEWAGMWSDFVSSASTDFEYQDTLDYTLQPDYDEEVSDTGLTNFRDSVMAQKRSLDSVIAYVDSVRNDTTTNYVALDSIYNWSDTAQIKTKLSKFFIPNVSPLQSCPAFEFTETWPVIGEQRTYINFGNVLNGVDLCELIRGFVRIATLIFILFNSVRAIIRAFSSGGT